MQNWHSKHSPQTCLSPETHFEQLILHDGPFTPTATCYSLWKHAADSEASRVEVGREAHRQASPPTQKKQWWIASVGGDGRMEKR